MTIYELLKKTEEEENYDTLRSYSGRSMYGKECVAISGDHEELMDQIATAITVLCDYVEWGDIDSSQRYDLIHKLLQFKQDSMGLGVVYYWPCEEWNEEEEEETEDDEELCQSENV